ncbi:MAG: sodium transporter, partial [Candidatus Aureabacteria bacterium]|nr:sodium transporter [Candidatus Auribacterota bacterium]
MKPIDYFFLVAYFFIVFFIGYISSKKSRTDSKNYFLAGSSIGWMAIGASLFASNISAEHFIGLAGSGAQGGLAVGQFEWLACFILLLLGWVFVPLYIKTGVFTMPEFLEKRYNKQCRTYLSSISLIAYIFTKISVSIYAGAIVLKTILGWNIWFGAVILIVATGIYTI